MQNQENPTNQPTDGGGEVDLLALVGWVWRRRLIFVLMAFLGAVLAVGYSYTVTKRYTATVLLLPKIPAQQEGLFAQLAKLSAETAARERINEGLYGQVLSSDLILNKVAGQKWASGAGSDSVSLFDVFSLSDPDPEMTEEFRSYVLRKRLRKKMIRFDRDMMTGVMKISATVPDFPWLAPQIANFLADEVQDYNSGLNSKRAVKHQEFVASRLEDIQLKLQVAEMNLTEFLDTNSRYNASPTLMQRHKELEREAQALRTIWVQLRAQLETAIIEANKELDSINILDRAVEPFRRSSPIRFLYLLAGGFWGLLLAIPITLVQSRRG